MTKISNQYSLTNVLFADAVNGRVGIGTSSPTELLTISGTQPNSVINYTSASDYGRIYFSESGTFKAAIQFMGSTFVATARRNALEIVNTTTGDLALGTGDTRTFYIKNGGNVGIGTSTPNLTAANRTTVDINGTTECLLAFSNGGTSRGYIYHTATDNIIWAEGARNMQFGIAGAGFMGFGTNNTERMRITSAGNVGIGTSSPKTISSGLSLTIGDGATAHQPYLALARSATGGWWAGIRWYDGDTIKSFIQEDADFNLRFGTSNTERMRITSAGQVSIGTTSTVSTYLLNVKAQTGAQAINITGRDNTDGAGVLQWTNQYGTYLGYIEVNSTAMYVARGSGGVYITTNATSWTSNSDSRLKNIISPINNAVDKLSTLNPVVYSWKSDETNKENIGLIAQDVEAVLPQVIDINKDGFLGVRYSELVPVLVKAIQELSAQASEQQTQINELKALLNA